MVERQLELNLDNDLIVYQSNSLAMAKYDMSAMEQKLFLIMIATIRKDDESFNRTVFKVRDLAELMQTPPQVLYRDLNKVCRNLMSRVVEVKKENGDWDMFQIIKHAKYKNKEGSITMAINEEAEPYLLQLNEFFSVFELNQAISLSGKYSLRLYQQAKSNIYRKEYIISLDEFKDILKLKQKSYNVFSNINSKVLKPSIEEINKNTDLCMNVEPIKVGKKVEALKFTVKKTEQQKVIVSKKNKKIDNSLGLEDKYKTRRMDKDYLGDVLSGQAEYDEQLLYK